MAETHNAVFISYASQDAEAARRICAALRQVGVEVWFDQNELVGGDAWDTKIRRQIKECALFVPIVSSATQARREGYFRIEWKLAAQRTHAMAEGTPFLLPLVLDGVPEPQALVPPEFRDVQATSLSDDDALRRFCARVQQLLDRPQAAVERPAGSATAARGRSEERRKAPRVAIVVGAFVVLALGIAVALVRPWSRAAPAPKPTPQVVAMTRSAELAQRARIETRDELDLAVEQARRRTESASDSATAWAARARLEAQYIVRGWDTGEQRRQDTQTHARRALAIDANSADAMFALAVVLLQQEAFSDAEALMRDAIVRVPGDAELRQALGTALSGQGREVEALAFRQETLRLFPDNPFAHYDLALSLEKASPPDLEAALRKFEDSFARGRFANTILHRASLLAGWKGDLPGARQLLESLDPLERTSDRAVGLAMAIALLDHRPERAIEAAGLTAQNYFDDDYVRGPKAWALAHAYAMAGKQHLAQAQWREAADVLRQRTRAKPGNWFDDAGLAVTLAWLGATDEAARIMEPLESIAQERMRPLERLFVAYYHAGCGDARKTAACLQPILNRRELLTERTLPLDPWWDKVRGQPEFAALLAKAGPERHVPDAKSVAVLPFANLSGDAEQEYFSDGLTEEILNALARERDLRVPGRSSSFSFKGKNVPAAEIARALNVSRLVEGSVRKSGNKVRISVSLTRASDGFSEELGTFTEELSDIFALQDKVASAVVAKLTQRAGMKSVASLTNNPEAYDAYLRGRALQTRAAHLRIEAAAHYERAVALDPAFALAWARLAEARFRDYSGLFNRSAKLVTTSREAIDRALAAQADLPEGLIMRANWVREVAFDFTGAQRDLDRAEALQPPTADLRQAQAYLARDQGNWPEALRRVREALELDPQNGDFTNAFAFSIYVPRGDWMEADRLFARAMEIQGTGSPIPLRNRLRLRSAWRGPEAALRLIERAPTEQAKRDVLRADVLASLGRANEARVAVDRVEQQAPAGVRLSLELLSPGSTAAESLSMLEACGRQDLARQVAEELRTQALKQREAGNRAPWVRRSLIQAETTLGHPAVALAALEEWRSDYEKFPSVFRRIHEFHRMAIPLYAALGQADVVVALLRECSANGYQVDFTFDGALYFWPVRDDQRIQEWMKQHQEWKKTLPNPIDL